MAPLPAAGQVAAFHQRNTGGTIQRQAQQQQQQQQQQQLTPHPPPAQDVHAAYFYDCMGFVHGGVEYQKGYIFPPSELLELTPDLVAMWMNDSIFGDPFPSPTDRPRLRSGTVEQHKKGVSHYMPNPQPWSIFPDGTGIGNPTRSKQVNNIIAIVKKKEARGEGVPTNAKRPETIDEFRMSQNLLRECGAEHNDDLHSFKYPCMALTQFHVIGRIDDCCHLCMNDPHGHPRFPFALDLKVSWSKNVREERECPPQILMGAQDPHFCPSLSLAMHMETFLKHYPEVRLFRCCRRGGRRRAC